MAQRKRSTAQKLMGWGILGGAVIAVIAIFLITRAFGPSTPAPAPSTSAALQAAVTAAAQSSAAAASSQPAPAASLGAPASHAPEAPASSSTAASQPSAPAPSASPVVPVPPAGTAVADAAAMNQSDRRDFLNRLIGQGVFTAVVPVPAAKVGVTPLFQGLKPDLQLQFLAIAYAYIHNGAAATDPLQLIDVTNGKVIGNFTNGAGLQPT